MGLLSRKDLLKKDDLQVTLVDLGNDEFVYVREMTGHDRDAFERSLRKRKEEGEKITFEMAMEDYRAKLVVLTICDETGKSILYEEDYEILSNNMGAKRLEKIVEASQKLNAITDKDKEALVKNSSAEPTDNSNSDSAVN
jgi:hypothetical protein